MPLEFQNEHGGRSRNSRNIDGLFDGLLFDGRVQNMGVLSKIFPPIYTTESCAELGHTWDPSCSSAGFGIFKTALVESIKIYTPLFLVSQDRSFKVLNDKGNVYGLNSCKFLLF